MKKVLKSIYSIIPFKKEFFSILKLFWQPKESIYRHLHFKGVFNVKTDESKSFKLQHYGYQLENEIFWDGLIRGWEKESMKLWIELCKKSRVIFDIGANTGIYSLVAKTVKPDSDVYSFEPVIRVFSKLNDNIALNNYDINTYCKAISNNDGRAIIYDTPTEHVYSVTVNKNLRSEKSKVIETQIDTTTLNSFIERNRINKIDLMKIDVETHEPEILEGFSKYLNIFKPTMLIEILDDKEACRINSLLEKTGYLFFNINEKTGIYRVDKITKSDHFNFLLCSPDVAKSLKLI